MDYQEYVIKGKAILQKVEAYQMTICKLAVEVCTIRHGGRSNGFYTIKDYAEDIGMKSKTLQNWIAAYRNVAVKLEVEPTTDKEWSKVRQTNDIIRHGITEKNKRQGKIVKGGASRIAKEHIQQIYSSISDEKPFQLEFMRQRQAAKYILYILSKRDLSIISDTDLISLMTLLDNSSDIINDYLSNKRKYA